MRPPRPLPPAAARAAPAPPRAAAADSPAGGKPPPKKRAPRKKAAAAEAPPADAAAAAAPSASTPPSPAPDAAPDAAPPPDASIPFPDPDAPLTAPIWAGRRGGYTPFEFVDFADDDVLHDVAVTVAAPRDVVYGVWADRLNYGEWFSLIAQSIAHVGDDTLASYFVFYAHGTLPPLELYVTLKRDLVPPDAILERSVDGWEVAAGVFFSDAPDGSGHTVVTLRLGYALPAQLADAVGATAVYGDVEERLRADMRAMARFVEAAAADGGGAPLAARRADERATIAASHAARYGKPVDEGLAAVMAAPGDGLYDAEMVGAVADRE